MLDDDTPCFMCVLRTISKIYIKQWLTRRPTVMLRMAMSFFPALREIEPLKLKAEDDEFPAALP